MRLKDKVSFLARLQAENRIQIPVEIRWRYKLEPGQILRLKINPVGSLSSEEFHVRLQPSGRVNVPWEVVWALELKQGLMLRVLLFLGEEK
ncbi:MAG: hypothetical protein ACP5ER_05600 [Candidatus Bathyarchaeales archaeon]